MAVSALKTDLWISQQLAQIYVSEGDSFQVIKKVCVRLWLAHLRTSLANDVYLPKISLIQQRVDLSWKSF